MKKFDQIEIREKTLQKTIFAMLYTKSIQAQKELTDEIRISIMRKPRGDYDLLIPALAPSELLLNLYHENEIDWDAYERTYLREIQNNPDVPKILQCIIDAANIADITLLCWEQTPEKCHRRLVAELISTMSKNKIEIDIK